MQIPAIRRVPYEKEGQVAYFDVGFRTLQRGCSYVMNPDDGRLEFIYSIETRYEEGREHTRIETDPGKWYELDGQTQLARMASRDGAVVGATAREMPNNVHDRRFAAAETQLYVNV